MTEAMPRGDRVPRMELEHRLSLIMPMVIDGYSLAEIQRLVAIVAPPKRFEVSDRTMHRYIASCHLRLFAAAERLNTEECFAIAYARLNRLFTKASNAKDLGNAIRAQKAIIDLLGLAAPARLNVVVRHESEELAEQMLAIINEAERITEGATDAEAAKGVED